MTSELPSTNRNRPFIEGNVVYGRVVDVQQNTSLPSRSGKWAALLAGGSWQIGQHQWSESVIFVEPVSAMTGSTVERALHMSGAVTGVRSGHVIEAQVRVRGDELYVTRMVDLTTQSAVRAAGEEMTPTMGCLLVALAAVIVVGLGMMLIGAAQSGALAAGVATVAGAIAMGLLQVVLAVLAAVGPLILVIAMVAWIVRLIFH